MDELFETIFFKALKADSTDIHFKRKRQII